MQQTKSYMLPKLICVNVLALMMFTFEHEVPADNNPLLKSAKAKTSSASDKAVLVQAAASPTVVAQPESEVVGEPAELQKASYRKQRMHHSRAALHGQAMLLRARYHGNSAVDCCFRGNRI